MLVYTSRNALSFYPTGTSRESIQVFEFKLTHYQPPAKAPILEVPCDT
jgi:hypothetical protein